MDETNVSKRVWTEAKKFKFPAVHVSITVVNRDGTEKCRSRTMVFMNEAEAHDYYRFKNEQLTEELPKVDKAIGDLLDGR